MGIERRGFAALTPERRKEIATQGGKRAQQLGVGHQWTHDEAKLAGRKGGLARHAAVKDAPIPAGNEAA